MSPSTGLFQRSRGERAKIVPFRCSLEEIEFLQEQAEGLHCAGVGDLLRLVLRTTDFRSIRVRELDLESGQTPALRHRRKK